MFDLVNGLPIHPLVVHGVVVLLPLAALATLALALRPAWRTRFGVLALATAAAATSLVPVATASGEALAERVGDPGRHAALGTQLLWFAIPMLVLLAMMVGLERRHAGGRGTPVRPLLRTGVAVLAVAAALATSVQVYRIGDSGARAAWGDVATARTS